MKRGEKVQAPLSLSFMQNEIGPFEVLRLAMARPATGLSAELET